MIDRPGSATTSTTAGGWPASMRSSATLMACAFLLGPSASTSATLKEGMRPARVAPPQTNAGMIPRQSERRRAGEALFEIRRIGGFTWDQLARLFSVTRRSLHFWASGQAMSSEKEERLHRLASFMRQADRGSPEATRGVLLSVAEDGRIPFELLAEGRYDDAASLVGDGQRRPTAPRPPRLRERPASWAPEELVDALNDRAHTPTPLRASKRGRSRRGRA
jgi:transcriptional regulator with XRE-family HTH domain